MGDGTSSKIDKSVSFEMQGDGRGTEGHVVALEAFDGEGFGYGVDAEGAQGFNVIHGFISILTPIEKG